MKQLFKIFMGGSMAAWALMFSACSSSDIELTPQQPNTQSDSIPFIATISMGESATTRALTEDATNKEIIPSWVKGEKVALVHNGVSDEMTVSSVTNGTATITGTITGTPANGDAVTIIYPSSAADGATGNVKADLLTNQDGTLATIADKYDVRKATAKLNVGTTATLQGNVSLDNQYAIVKFSLTDGTNDINATQFLVRDGNDNVLAAVKPASASSTLYVAIPPATTSTFRFKAATATSSYFYSKSGATLAAGKYYQSSLKLALVDMLHTPLTLEATEDGTTVTIKNGSNVTYSYKVNSGTTVTKSSDASFTLNAGDIVQFNSTNSALVKTFPPYGPSAIDALTIIVDKKSYVYGNVMSMVNDNGGDFADDVTLADSAMPYLFCGNYSTDNYIAFLADKPLMLPATNISKYCYYSMFSYCTELTALPSGFLPATVMKEGCYEFMFDQCSGLTSLPDDLLPATTLAEKCYMDMFQSCSGLTTLADDLLPATTLADKCYEAMFHICTGLTHAPILRAPTLVDNCYNRMFASCNKLSEVTCLATDISATNCLYVWLSSAGSKVSGPKTLYVDPSMTTKGTGFYYDNWNLETGWALQTYVAP